MLNFMIEALFITAVTVLIICLVAWLVDFVILWWNKRR